MGRIIWLGLEKASPPLHTSKMAWSSAAHIPVLFIVQVAFIILFAVFARYDPKMAMKNNFKHEDNQSSVDVSSDQLRGNYAMFQDIHVMIFVGFGFLMTFLKKYSYGAVGYNMFISALVLQWATLMGGWLETAFEGAEFEKISLDLTTMIGADFACGAVLITFGAVLGKVS